MENVQPWYSGPGSSDAAAIERRKPGCRDGYEGRGNFRAAEAKKGK